MTYTQSDREYVAKQLSMPVEQVTDWHVEMFAGSFNFEMYRFRTAWSKMLQSVAEAWRSDMKQIGSPRMTAVPRLDFPKVDEIKGCCAPQVALFGGLGYCRKHSPFVTPQNMGWVRYLKVRAVEGGKIIVGTVLPFIIILCVVIAFALILYKVMLIGLEKQELVACYQHQQYAQTLRDYAVSESEVSRCDALGVSIAAPVK